MKTRKGREANTTPKEKRKEKKEDEKNNKKQKEGETKKKKEFEETDKISHFTDVDILSARFLSLFKMKTFWRRIVTGGVSHCSSFDKDRYLLDR